jgi:hypothetical protein
MYSVCIEMPLGNRSKPREFPAELDARHVFESFIEQMLPWKKFRADVILMENGKEIDHTGIENNA